LKRIALTQKNPAFPLPCRW